MTKRALLINPWIYDFKAFDFWSKPLGLLYLASILKSYNWHIDYIDCLDRYHPLLLKNISQLPKTDQYGRGKFYAEVITKPPHYQHYPRKYKRYGMPESVFREILQTINKPDWIFITSIMTYWYPGVFRAINILKEHFPDTPLVLGGIYATLAFRHAQQYSRSDYVLSGMAEQNLHRLIPEIKPINFNKLPFPAFDLYTKLDYACLLTSRGCCFKCVYCAVPYLTPHLHYRSASSVIQEIEYYQNLNVKNIAFYDDALLSNPNIQSILDQIISRNFNINFHSPNGLHPRFFTQELSDKMYAAGFKTIYLSLETIDLTIHKSIDNKVTVNEFIQAINYLRNSGFNSSQIHTYLLIGLPQIDCQTIKESIDFVHDLGIISHLAEYSPIPQTNNYTKFFSSADPDPLFHNNAVFPALDKKMREKIIELKAYHSRLRNTF